MLHGTDGRCRQIMMKGMTNEGEKYCEKGRRALRFTILEAFFKVP